MKRVHPAPAETVLQGKSHIFQKSSVEEISRDIRQFAPDYCRNGVNDEPQALFDKIRCFVSTDLARFSPGMAHGALLQIVHGVHIGRSPQWDIGDDSCKNAG